MDTPSPTRQCAFETDRLSVGEWSAMAKLHELDLEGFVASALTPVTTETLPPEWQGDFDHDRARRWIKDRDAESAMLLTVERSSADPVGLMILFEMPHEGSPEIELRIGYIIIEQAWGKGLASELVEGVVEWARGQAGISSISGGVAEDNPASSRALVKNGFRPAPDSSGGEQMSNSNYRRPRHTEVTGSCAFST